MIINRYLFLLFGAMCLVEFSYADDLFSPNVVVFHEKGDFHEPSDLSAVARVGKHIVVGSDEGHVIQILAEKSLNIYELVRKFSIPDGKETDRTKDDGTEIDIEGITAREDVIFIIGSHSRKRSKVEVRNPKRRKYERIENDFRRIN